jgi:predicted ATPase with chaperone activity
MLAKIFSRAAAGIDAPAVTVEVLLSNGLPALNIAGLTEAAGQQLLERAMEQLGLSARAYHRVLKVARTIADLAGSETDMSAYVAEAVCYRVLDRKTAV